MHAGAHAGEVVARIDGAVADVGKDFAMKTVRPRAGGYRHNAGASAEIRRVQSRENLELADGLDGGLHHHGVEGPLVVDDAIDQPGVRIGLAAQRVEVRGRTRIEGTRAGEIFAGLSSRNARNKINELGKIPPVQRQVLHLLLADDLAKF